MPQLNRSAAPAPPLAIAARSAAGFGVAVAAVAVGPAAADQQGPFSGEFRAFHALTGAFTGPAAAERDGTFADPDPNPFLDYRMDVTFTHAGTGATLAVPGHFAADGDAANTSADAGDVWRVYFAPPEPGVWDWSVSFRAGPDVAIADDPGAFPSAGFFDGAAGSVTVEPTDKAAPDFRARGFLTLEPGDRHLRFSGDRSWWLKTGADSPENFLGYYEFDNTFDNGGQGNELTGPPYNDGLHHYDPHLADYAGLGGGPTWAGGKGERIIGAVNYLASEGVNSVYFLTMNAYGDGREVFPWSDYPPNSHTLDHVASFDVSKLDQWNIVFSHMTSLGVALHVLTQETENDQFLDGGDLGPERKLYYRELVSRFAHHPALVWNLGEENTNTSDQVESFADFIKSLDAYNHPTVLHTYPGQKEQRYAPLLGFANLDGLSLQGSASGAFSTALEWIERSAAAGRPWFVCQDEIGPATTGVTPDGANNNHATVRRDALWGNLMAGGAGAEWYFGYSLPHNDLDCEDFRSRDRWWDYNRFARDFFETHVPFHRMNNADELITASDDARCLAAPGEAYVVYIEDDATSVDLDLGPAAAVYTVRWFDPRNGGPLRTGSIPTITGPGAASIGAPPPTAGADADWAALVLRDGDPTLYTLTVENGSGDGEFPAGSLPPILADAPPTGLVFDRWLGSGVADPFAASTSVLMPAADRTVTATYTDAPPGPEVTRLLLCDADANTDLRPILDGDVIPRGLLPDPAAGLTVRAIVAGPEVSQVRFERDGQTVQTENFAPYMLAGDSSGDYDPASFTVGVETTVRAAPVAAADGSDGTARQATFTITDPACPVDPDGDGDTDVSDFIRLAGAFGSDHGDERYHRPSDFNGDLQIDVDDFIRLASAFGCAP